MRKYADELRLFLTTIDFSFVFVASILATLLRFGIEDWWGIWISLFNQHPFFYFFIGLAWVVILNYSGLYQARQIWTYAKEIQLTLKSIAILAMIVVFLIFILKFTISRLYVSYFLTILFSGTLLIRISLRTLFFMIRSKGYNYRQVLIIGADERGREIENRIKKYSHLGYKIIGFLDDDESKHPMVIGRLNNLEDILKNNVVDEVFITLPLSDILKIRSIVDLTEEIGRNVRVALDIDEVLLTKGNINKLDDMYVLNITNTPKQDFAMLAKRLFDICFSLTVIIILAPVFFILALVVKLNSPGPVFFKQERVGLNGRKFKLYKFRSMYIDAEERLKELQHLNEMSGPVFKIKDDPRITKAGKFLRKTSLDELPQFLNVLKGEMSIVGPRPPLTKEVAEYDNWHRRRLSVKPGITCIWQVSGRNDISFEQWMKMDLEYIDSWNFWLDIKIIIETVKVVLVADGH